MNNFSMKEWKPELAYNKLQRLEQQISDIEEKKLPLVNDKRKIEVELNEVNIVLKEKHYSDKDFNDINSKRGRLVKQKSDIEIQLSNLKQTAKKLHTEKELLQLDLKKKPNEAIKENLICLRNEYQSFASDMTRVSSMRAMASRFVEEIQSILKLIP